MPTIDISSKNLIVAAWSQMDRWVIPAIAILGGKLPAGWISAKVGDIVQVVTDRIQVDANHEYKMAGVRWYGEGVFHRETVVGQRLSAKYITPLKAGAFIYNRLFAWKASFAVVPTELADCYVSNEFPQFLTDSSKLIPEYLYLWSLTENTLRAVNAASTGSAAVSRNRFREEFFLHFELALPPIDKQRAIASAWEQAKTEIAAMKARIAGMESQIETEFLAALGLSKPKRVALPRVFGIQWKELDRWSIEFIKRTFAEKKTEHHRYPVRLIGDLCNGQSGSTPSKRNRAYWKGSIPWVSPKDMKTDLISDTIDHISEEALNSGGVPLIPEGSVLIVVRSGILQHTVPIAVNTVDVSINQDMRALIPKPDAPVTRDFIAVFLKCSQHKLLSQVKWSTTVQSINKESIEIVEIPLPPLSVQKDLLEKVTAQRNAVTALKAEADEKLKQARTDLDAMILGVKPVPAS